MKFTFETDSLQEAQMIMDAVSGRGNHPVTTPPGVTVADGVSTEPVPNITMNPEDRQPPADPVADVDVDGMPWNEDYHAATKAQNADGTWKARKGKAEEAKAARAAFKASGGNVTPPADVTPEPAGMPGTAPEPVQEPAGMPGAAAGMPGTAPEPVADMPPPISQAQLETKAIHMLTVSKTLSNQQYSDLLTKHDIPHDDPTSALATNESLRAAFYTDLCHIEPDA